MKATPISIAQEAQMLSLGRQAHQAGYPIGSCNLGHLNLLRSFWVAGWIDADIEAGNRLTDFYPTTKQEAA